MRGSAAGLRNGAPSGCVAQGIGLGLHRSFGLCLATARGCPPKQEQREQTPWFQAMSREHSAELRRQGMGGRTHHHLPDGAGDEGCSVATARNHFEGRLQRLREVGGPFLNSRADGMRKPRDVRRLNALLVQVCLVPIALCAGLSRVPVQEVCTQRKAVTKAATKKRKYERKMERVCHGPFLCGVCVVSVPPCRERRVTRSAGAW